MTEWILSIITQGGYVGIAFLMALENVFPPIPSEVIMGLAGIAVARGSLSAAPVMVAATIGTVAGNLVWYEAGRRLGYRRFKPLIDRWGRWATLDWPAVIGLIAFFRSYGHHVVFWLRFSPFARTIISLPAGLARMGRMRFLLYTTAGSFIWNGLLLGAGYVLGSRFEELAHYTGPVAIATAAVAAAIYAWRVAFWRPKVRTRGTI